MRPVCKSHNCHGLQTVDKANTTITRWGFSPIRANLHSLRTLLYICSSERYKSRMIVVKLNSGLGNQFFQYAMGRSLAMKHYTGLMIEIGSFATDDLRDFKLNHFQIKAELVDDFQSQKLLFTHPLFLLKARTGGIKDVHDSVWKMTPPESIGDDSILRGYWGNDLYLKHIRELLLDELTLRPQSETPHYLEVKKQMAETQSVALHIRRGDYLDSTNKDIFNLLEMSYYERAITLMNEKVTTPVYFIFSDSIPWVKEHFHLPQRYEMVSDNVLLDVHDLSLMRHCRHNIIANSTFSWWGAWLNTNPGKIMIAPKKWYHKEEAQQAYESGEVLHCKEFIRL